MLRDNACYVAGGAVLVVLVLGSLMAPSDFASPVREADPEFTAASGRGGSGSGSGSAVAAAGTGSDSSALAAALADASGGDDDDSSGSTLPAAGSEAVGSQAGDDDGAVAAPHLGTVLKDSASASSPGALRGSGSLDVSAADDADDASASGSEDSGSSDSASGDAEASTGSDGSSAAGSASATGVGSDASTGVGSDASTGVGRGDSWGGPAECYPDIPLSPVVPEGPPEGITFSQLRYMITGRCPAPLSPRAATALQAFVDRQNAMLAGDVPMRALMWECSNHDSCGGHADRLKGMLFSFWVAFLSKRAFFVKYTKPVKLATAYLENEVKWAEPKMLSRVRWKTLKLVGNRAAGVKAYKKLIETGGQPHVRVYANLVLHKLMDAIRDVADPELFAVAEELHLSVRVSMDMLFRPSPGLLAKMRKHQMKTVDVWNERRPIVCVHCRTSVADGKKSRYGEGHLSKIVQGVDWMLGRLRQRAGGVSYNAEAVVYVASDDPTSAAQLTARPHRASIKYHQLDLPVFHVDRRARGGHAVKDMFLDVIAEHQLLAMCDGWVMPGSGFPETAYMWADGPPGNAMALLEDHKGKTVSFSDVRVSNHIWTHTCPELRWPDEPLLQDELPLTDELKAPMPWHPSSE